MIRTFGGALRGPPGPPGSGGSGDGLQGAYDNGDTITIDSGDPVTIAGGTAADGAELLNVGGSALTVCAADATYAPGHTNSTIPIVRIKRLLGYDAGDGNVPETQFIELCPDADCHIFPAESRTIEGGRLVLRGGQGSVNGTHDGQDRHFGGDVCILGGLPGTGSSDRGGQIVIDASPVNQGGAVSPNPFYGSTAYPYDAPAGVDQWDVNLGAYFAKKVQIGRMTTTTGTGTWIKGGIDGVQIDGTGPVKIGYGYSTTTAVNRFTIQQDETAIYGTNTSNAVGAYLKLNQFGAAMGCASGGSISLLYDATTRLSVDGTSSSLVGGTMTLTGNASGAVLNVTSGSILLRYNSTTRFTADSTTATITGTRASNQLVFNTSGLLIDSDAGFLRGTDASQPFKWGNNTLAFFAGALAAKQTVTGSRTTGAALASLLSALATYGLITDSSSA